MKIQSFNASSSFAKNKQKNNYAYNSNLAFGIATGRTHGGSGYLNYPIAWSAKKLAILTRTKAEMEDLAEYFHNKTNEELHEVARKAHWFSDDNYGRAAKRLIEFVTPIRSKRASMDAKIIKLEAKTSLLNSEKEELANLKNEVKRLDRKVSMVREYFESMISW